MFVFCSLYPAFSCCYCHFDDSHLSYTLLLGESVQSKSCMFSTRKINIPLKESIFILLNMMVGPSFTQSSLSQYETEFFALNWCRVFFGSSDILRDESKVANIFSLDDALGFGSPSPSICSVIQNTRALLYLDLKNMYTHQILFALFLSLENVLKFQVYGRRSHKYHSSETIWINTFLAKYYAAKFE